MIHISSTYEETEAQDAQAEAKGDIASKWRTPKSSPGALPAGPLASCHGATPPLHGPVGARLEILKHACDLLENNYLRTQKIVSY